MLSGVPVFQPVQVVPPPPPAPPPSPPIPAPTAAAAPPPSAPAPPPQQIYNSKYLCGRKFMNYANIPRSMKFSCT